MLWPRGTSAYTAPTDRPVQIVVNQGLLYVDEPVRAVQATMILSLQYKSNKPRFHNAVAAYAVRTVWSAVATRAPSCDHWRTSPTQNVPSAEASSTSSSGQRVLAAPVIRTDAATDVACLTSRT